MMKKLTWTLLIAVWASWAAAQGGDCLDIVQEALETAATVYENTRDNQLCYGAGALEVEAQSGLDDFEFADVGDLVDAAGVESLLLSEDEWSVALMRLRAGLADENI